MAARQQEVLKKIVMQFLYIKNGKTKVHGNEQKKDRQRKDKKGPKIRD